MNNDSKIIVMKAFEVVDGLPRFFKHPNDKSRFVPLDEWIKADCKTVRDGSGNNYYKSAFHIMCQDSDFMGWCKSLRTYENRVSCLVLAKGVRSKKNSRFGMYLADEIKLTTSFWDGRISLNTVLG